jgi:hypothetical protein
VPPIIPEPISAILLRAMKVLPLAIKSDRPDAAQRDADDGKPSAKGLKRQNEFYQPLLLGGVISIG